MFVAAEFGNTTSVKDRDLVSVLDGGQPMSDDHYCTSNHDPLQSFLYQILALRVQCTAAIKQTMVGVVVNTLGCLPILPNPISPNPRVGVGVVVRVMVMAGVRVGVRVTSCVMP